LWLSGLRLEESLNLYWDRSDKLHIDLTGKHPRLSIPEACEKGHRNRLLPLTPDFADFILATPLERRHGPVFDPRSAQGRASYDVAGRTISLIGELAGVKVHTHPKTGKVKYASAHDLRRSFGDRWSRKVMPAVLQKLMRHESIETTMRFYVGLDADSLADELYRNRPEGTVSGTVDPIAPQDVVNEGGEKTAASDDNTSGFGE
jgi:integrase